MCLITPLLAGAQSVGRVGRAFQHGPGIGEAGDQAGFPATCTECGEGDVWRRVETCVGG